MAIDLPAEQRAFEDAVWSEYFVKNVKRNPNPPRGTGALNFVYMGEKTQAELLERVDPPAPGQQTYKDQAIDAMWFGWCLARKRGPCVVDGACLLKTQ